MKKFREPNLEPPHINDETPCDSCEVFGGRYNNEMDCDEDHQHIDSCSRWNPPPHRCDACGKYLSDLKRSLCKDCQKINDYSKILLPAYPDEYLTGDYTFEDDSEDNDNNECVIDEIDDLVLGLNLDTLDFDYAYLNFAYIRLTVDIRPDPPKVYKYPAELLINIVEEDIDNDDESEMDHY